MDTFIWNGQCLGYKWLFAGLRHTRQRVPAVYQLMSIAFDSRNQFVRDLTRLRERQGMSLEDLSVRTKVAHSTLEEFEQARLLDNPLFNQVYLRSLAKTYALHVGVLPDVMMQALEEMLAGQYGGRLSPGYVEKDEDPAQDVQPPTEEDAQHPPEAPELAEDAAAASPEGDTFTAVLASATNRRATPPGSSRRFRRRVRPQSLWIACTLLLAAGAAAAAFWLFPGPGAPSEGNTSGMVLGDPAASDSQTAAAIRFGARIHATAFATDIVERLQVRIDDDLRRPYWIESDSALVFSFEEQIMLERRLHLIRLFADSYEIALDTVDIERPFVLTRSMLEQLAADGKLVAAVVPPATDSIRVSP